jgi:hypothetical protein
MTATLPNTKLEELDYRENEGIEVSLLWNRSTNSISVLVVDTKTNQSFEATVANEQALDAFNHPYAAGRSRGVVLGQLSVPGQVVAVIVKVCLDCLGEPSSQMAV